MKILFLTNYFRPEANVIFSDIADECVREGHEVAVVTVHPSYPLGRFFDSVTTIRPQISYENGMKVLRLPTFPDKSRRVFHRALSYITSTLVVLFTAPFFMVRPQCVIVYQTPFSMGLTALWFRWVMRARVIFVTVDLWPESFCASGINLPKWLNHVFYRYSRWINLHSDHIIATTRGMQMRYINDGLSKERVSLVPVWVDGIHAFHSGSEDAEPSYPISICYAGNLGPAQQLDVIVEAAQVLRDHSVNAVFEIYGTGSEELRLREIVARRCLNNITFHGYVEPDEAFRACCQASAILVHLRASPLFNMTVPSKLYAAFAAGGIVICGSEGESADMVEGSGAGFAFKPGNGHELAAIIMKISKMSRNERRSIHHQARVFYDKNLSKERLVSEHLHIISHVVKYG